MVWQVGGWETLACTSWVEQAQLAPLSVALWASCRFLVVTLQAAVKEAIGVAEVVEAV